METSISKQTAISPLLSGYQAGYVKAQYGVRVTSLSEPEAETALLELINRAMLELGQSPTGSRPEDRKKYLGVMARMTLNDIKLYFPQVTLEEVANAIRRGIRREYGEYFGFNVIAIHGFIEKYLESDDRNDALAKQNRFLLTQEVPGEPPAINQREIMEAGLARCYEIFKKTGRIIDCGNVNYEMLVKEGRINLTNEEKHLLFKEAERLIRHEEDQQAGSFHQIVARLKGKETDHGTIVSRAKELALKRYFESLHSIGGLSAARNPEASIPAPDNSP